MRNVVALGASYNRTCALTTSGEVQCWGRDKYQDETGSVRASRVPLRVAGLPSNVVAISVGKRHSCALAGDGYAYCWGENEVGQLGDGSSNDSYVPVKVALPGIRSIVAAKNYTCALVDGAVSCWGRNSEGQLGNDAPAPSAVPVPVSGLSRRVRAISATGDFACALVGSAAVRCWGENDHGQLGNGTTLESRVPVPVRDPGKDLVAIAVGANHACTLSKRGDVRCWGRNDHGQLGDGTTKERHVPVPVHSLGPGVVGIGAGASGHFVCALNRGGLIKCWGRNTHGQLGNGTTTDSPTPVTVLTLT